MILPGPTAGRSRLLGPGLILLAAAIATAPILLHGSYCGDDFEFHVVSWFDVQQSWLHGIPYPHWMPSANYGAGEPRFMFYPPVTWMLGAALGFVLPWALAPVALVFLCLAATGLAVRALALEALPDAPATLAGCAALFSGFALFTAYERTAFAELTGGFWVPMLLLFALRESGAGQPLRRRVLNGSTLPMALLLAGAWLSNGPVGVMASYLLAAVAILCSLLARSWAPLLRTGIAGALGVMLPALYLLPAAREQQWADLRAAVDYPVFAIENNWLFAHHTDPMLARFQPVLFRASTLAVCMIGLAIAGSLILFLRGKLSVQDGVTGFARRWWVPLALIPIAVLFLQLPISYPLWNALPKLRFLQYPWRWVLVVEAPMAIFLAAAVWPSQSAARWRKGTVAAVCAIAFLTTTFLASRTFLRFCDEGDTVTDLLDLYQRGGGLEGTDEYEPSHTDHWKIARGLPDACLTADSDAVLGVVGPDSGIPAWAPAQGSCITTATAQVREPERLRIATVTPRAGYLVLRLVSYPAWRVMVNGKPAGALDERDDGLIAVPVPQGPVQVAVDWISTPDVIAGRWITACAVALLAGLYLLEKRRTTPHLS